MSKNSPQEQPKKKKRGFLGYLWLLFMIFMIISAMASGFFYWKRPLVTGWALELYAKRLAQVMTSPEYYSIDLDSSYHAESEGKENFLKNKRVKMKEAFDTLVKSYQKNPTSDWDPSLLDLHKQLRTIWEDQKVSPTEWDGFLGEVEKVIEKHKS